MLKTDPHRSRMCFNNSGIVGKAGFSGLVDLGHYIVLDLLLAYTVP